MSQKGMSQTLVIIVAAVVILVTALVLLTIFSGSLTPIASISQLQAQCETAGDQSCALTGQLPPTWDAKIYIVNNEQKSCSDLCENACVEINGKLQANCP